MQGNLSLLGCARTAVHWAGRQFMAGIDALCQESTLIGLAAAYDPTIWVAWHQAKQDPLHQANHHASGQPGLPSGQPSSKTPDSRVEFSH